MANDRLYLRCAGCGALQGVAKRFGGAWRAYGDLPLVLQPGATTWTSTPETRSLSDRLDAWFDEHDACGDGDYPCRPELVLESDGYG